MKILLQSILASCCLISVLPSSLRGDESVEQSAGISVSFASQIRPLLSDKCFACHGPDEQTREADLRLDVREEALAGEAIVPGSPDESELLRRISLPQDDDEKMPPRAFHKDLTEAEVELFRLWIGQGAPYQQHWSYRQLERPPVPQVAAEDADLVKNPIDAFILQSLRQHGLGFAGPTDKVTLIRRLYLDLVGMPPTQSEAQEFLEDSRADAVEHAVDALLLDPRFGERLAVHWLDLVRYADTIGYHSDTYMEVSAYRDYVIRSFNENKPFDRFTIEQLAGDLLPEATQEQLVASGYNRLLQTTEEGGAQAKEYISIYAADRVRNLSGVWMGQTVGCAQCHDHKYDPFTTKDFYSLAAFFADIDENAVGKRNPNFTLISAQQQQELASLTEKLAMLQIERRLVDDARLADALNDGQSTWEQATLQAIKSKDSPWRTPEGSSVSATAGVDLQPRDDGTFVATGKNPDVGSYTYSLESSDPIEAIRLEVFPDKSFPNANGFSRGNGNIVLTEVKVFHGDQPVPIAEALADYEQDSWPGLCIGHDTLFIQYCRVPMTVLAVKDRVTGHNPLAALYLSESPYYRRLSAKKPS